MAQSFTDFLRKIRNGLAEEELAEKLQALVQAVTDTEKAGTLTLTISIKPMTRAQGAMVIDDTIKLNAPEIKSEGTVMFATPEGHLERSSQRQPDLPEIALATSDGRARSS